LLIAQFEEILQVLDVTHVSQAYVKYVMMTLITDWVPHKHSLGTL
jgi:hypothetical protein